MRVDGLSLAVHVGAGYFLLLAHSPCGVAICKGGEGMTKKKCYIFGPMTKYKDEDEGWNFDAFDALNQSRFNEFAATTNSMIQEWMDKTGSTYEDFKEQLPDFWAPAIDAIVEGNIQAERQVLVSKDGEVKGDIESNEVIVGGRIEGSVRATGRVEVQSTATIDGDILTKRILVHEGGEVNGNLRMSESEVANGTLRSVAGVDRNPSVVRAATPTAG